MKHTSELARNLLTPACMVPVLNRFYPSNENTTGRTSQSYPRSGGKVERPKVPRFMQKNGHCNIRQAAQDKREKYMADFFTTFVDLDWLYSVALFISFYAITWVIFSFLYWSVAKFRGDIDFWAARHLFVDRYNKMANTDLIWYRDDMKRLGQFTKKEHTFSEAISDKSRARTVFESLQEQFPKEMSYINRTLNGSPYQPCFYNVGSYASAFLYFIETDTTIGFGRRSITDECPEAILLLVIQCLLGTLIDAFMVGCIFIKISKPKDRTDSLIFSDNAVIAQRDGKYCFMFRVGNLRDSLIVQCKIRAKFVRSKQTSEGEFLPLDQTDINIGFNTGADKLFLVTPLIICHEINEKSPFWGLSEADIQNEPFEIIVILEGTIESTGMICQARTSYLNKEINWGYRFMPMLFLDQHHFSADHSMFHSTYEVRMPVHSAMESEARKKVIEKDEEIKRSQNCTHKCPNSPGKETDVLTTMTTLTATPTATPPSEHRSLQAPNQRRSRPSHLTVNLTSHCDNSHSA